MLNPDNLAFDEAAHEYRWRGAVMPGVTTVLQDAGFYNFGPDRDALRVALERGRVVHKLTELDDNGTLDEDSVDPALVGYLAAWRLFRSEKHFIPSATEARVVHAYYKYAGTLDATGEMDDLRGRRHKVILDKKTGAEQRTTGYQTAAYLAALFDQCRLSKAARYGVYLQANGKYELVPYTNDGDLGVFLAALTCYNVRRMK